MGQRCNDPLHPPELTTTGAERRAFLGVAAAAVSRFSDLGTPPPEAARATTSLPHP